MIETNQIGVGDALLFGVVGALGLIPDDVLAVMSADPVSPIAQLGKGKSKAVKA